MMQLLLSYLKAGAFLKTIGIVIGLTFSLIGLKAYNVFIVTQAAKKLAGDKPYCIQVGNRSSQTDYRSATTLLDFSILTMRSSREQGMYMQRHAVLVLGKKTPQLYHWSYHNSQFEPDSMNQDATGRTLAVYCRPQQHFVSKLPPVFPRRNQGLNLDENYLYVRFDQQEFLIPNIYFPETDGGQYPSVRFLVSSDFEPINQSINRTTQLNRNIWIDVGKERVKFKKKWITQVPTEHGAEELEGKYGLKKRALRSEYGEEIQYYIANDTGEFTTLINCGSKSCQYRFAHHDLFFTIYGHPREDLLRWQEVQNNLIQLVDSFTIDSNN